MPTLLIAGLALLGLTAALALIWFLMVVFGRRQRGPAITVHALPIPVEVAAHPSGASWVALGFEMLLEREQRPGAEQPVTLRGRILREGSFDALDVALLAELETPVLSQAVRGDAFEFTVPSPEGRFYIQVTPEGRGSILVTLDSVSDARAEGLPLTGPTWKVLSPVTFHVPTSLTLEQAFRHAQPRDTISVEEGFYHADGLLPISEVTIRGKGVGRTFILLHPGRIPMHDVTVEDLTFFDTSSGRAELSMTGETHASETEFMFLEGPALAVRGDLYGEAALTLSRCVVHVGRGPLVRMAGPIGNLDIRECQLTGHDAVVELTPAPDQEGLADRVRELGERIRENNHLHEPDLRPVAVRGETLIGVS